MFLNIELIKKNKLVKTVNDESNVIRVLL